MTSWFIMIILSGKMEVGHALAKGGDACGVAIPAMSAAYELLHDDIDIICRDTGVPLMRPVARPERGEPT